MKPVLILTEATSRTGLGHLTRCSALAEILDLGGNEVSLYVNTDGITPLSPIGHKFTCMNWGNADQRQRLLDELQPSAIIVDSYLCDNAIYHELESDSRLLFCLDDYNRLIYPSKATVINPSIGGHVVDYSNQDAKILTGANYILLRTPFREPTPIRSVRAEIRDMLITLGSMIDENFLSQLVARIRATFPDTNLHILSNTNITQFSSEALIEQHKITLHGSLSAEKMKELIMSCDFAISAAGQTSNELAKCEIPMILVQTAENQRANILGWQECGITACNLSSVGESIQFLQHSLELMRPAQVRQSIRLKLREILKAPSAYDKLFNTRNNTSTHTPKKEDLALRLRTVKLSDMQLIFEWSNEKHTRLASLSTEEISWSEHENWFRGKIVSRDGRFWILETGNRPVGQIRLENMKEENHVRISYSIAPEHRGLGLGLTILSMAIAQNSNERNEDITYVATVKAENRPSARCFEKLGFTATPSSDNTITFKKEIRVDELLTQQPRLTY